MTGNQTHSFSRPGSRKGIKRTLGSLALTLAVGATATSNAAIPNFSFNGITGRGALEDNLNDRLGTSSLDTEHIINIEDCNAYLGGEIEVSFTIDPLPAVDSDYAIAYAAPGQTCSISSIDVEAREDACWVPETQKFLGSTTIEATIRLSDLMGGDCDANIEDPANIYVVTQESGATSVLSETIEVYVDLKRPTAPVIGEAEAGDRRFSVRWTDDINDEDDVDYTVYWDEVDFTIGALETVNKKDDVDATSTDIESSAIANDVPYYVRVVAVDDADNESELSDVVVVTPAETLDFWENYANAGGADQGDFCFVATAAYGTSMAAELTTLRQFRDGVLMQSVGGRALVQRYYAWGRYAAAWIADKPTLKAVARVLLVPLVWLAKATLALGPLGALAAFAMVCMVMVAARRRWITHIRGGLPLAITTGGN